MNIETHNTTIELSADDVARIIAEHYAKLYERHDIRVADYQALFPEERLFRVQVRERAQDWEAPSAEPTERRPDMYEQIAKYAFYEPSKRTLVVIGGLDRQRLVKAIRDRFVLDTNNHDIDVRLAGDRIKVRWYDTESFSFIGGIWDGNGESKLGPAKYHKAVVPDGTTREALEAVLGNKLYSDYELLPVAIPESGQPHDPAE